MEAESFVVNKPLSRKLPERDQAFNTQQKKVTVGISWKRSILTVSGKTEKRNPDEFSNNKSAAR